MKFDWRFVLPLAFAQLVSWGSLYYAFAVIAQPMAAELHWSKVIIDGALSAGLAATGLFAPFAGRIIDARGGREIMTLGSVVATLLLVFWSQIEAVWQLFAIWILMGASFSAILYEPVFAVMARELQEGYRKGIVTITLVAGFASTVFIPVTHWLVQEFGWRHALLGLAVLQVPFCIAVHWTVLRRSAKPVVIEHQRVSQGRVQRAMKQPVFWFLATSYAAHAFMFTGIIFHIIPLLTERGFDLPTIVTAYSVVGPFQVLGRIFVFSLEKRIDARMAGLIATSLPVVGIIVLLIAQPGTPLIYIFGALYGSGMGIKTIVQATAGPEFLGREGYGALQGAFAAINYAVQAVTPFALALLWARTGTYDTVKWVLFAAAVLSAIAFLVASLTPRMKVVVPAA